ncbi:MAG: isoprenylcysteine carboxylmethyltransferase family protein [Thermodesulfovibrionales bacterium]|nr:isoprenylcysteine carboxylmethyltransferase family protein [Thermodesulfovibrionales bacterium]
MVTVMPSSITSMRGMAGAALVLLGAGMRSWAAGVIKKSSTLATTGPYALSRHPLYLGSLFIALGFSATINDRFSIWAVLLIALVIYLPKIRQEERFLADKMKDEWAGYIERTSILFPKRFPVDVRAVWSFTQWKKNREYKAFLASLAGLAFLALYNYLKVRLQP